MKKYILILLLIACLGACEDISEECLETEEESEIEECQETEYQSYLECVRKRSKRSTGCSQSQDTCESCDCNYCSSNICNSQCNICCANFQQPCQTKYCCYKTCHSQCSNQGCRDSCRRTCTDRLIVPKTETVIQPAPQVPNITTIINLHNKINNTNIIDVPINLRTDNINNITINAGQFASKSNGTREQKCCQVVSPRQCTPTKEFPFMKCFHLRKRVCGNICAANIMHAQPHQVCDQSSEGGQADCHNQVIYIPQPQPKCVYKSEWPYVTCNIPPANCEGCYDHYATKADRPANCPSSCYDDGYGVGPYYRQGPLYRPGVAPMPSCIQMGNCPYYPGYGPPMGGGYQPMAPEYNPMPMPYSGVGYPPSTYDNFYTVQRNVEVPDLRKVLINFTQNDDYDAQTLPITNSITQSSPPQLDPRLVKIETVNATDVFMTIKEMNDEPLLEDNHITVTPTSIYTSATSNPLSVQIPPAPQSSMGVHPGYTSTAAHSIIPQVDQTMQPNTILHPEVGKMDSFGGIGQISAYQPVVRYQRDHNKVKKEDLDFMTSTSANNSTNINEMKNSTSIKKANDLIPDENKKTLNSTEQHITITPIKKGETSTKIF